MSRYSNVVIANGASLSSEIDLGDGDVLLGLVIPSAWTAAALTFTADADGDGTHKNVYDDAGTELTVASANVVADRHVLLNSSTAFAKLNGKIKIRSGVAATPVNQGAARTIVCVIGRRYI